MTISYNCLCDLTGSRDFEIGSCRQHGFFCLQGGQKGTLGRKELQREVHKF